MIKPRILIEVLGGIPTVTAATSEVEVHVIEWDAAKIGGRSYDGPETTRALSSEAFEKVLNEAVQRAVHVEEQVAEG